MREEMGIVSRSIPDSEPGVSGRNYVFYDDTRPADSPSKCVKKNREKAGFLTMSAVDPHFKMEPEEADVKRRMV